MATTEKLEKLQQRTLTVLAEHEHDQAVLEQELAGLVANALARLGDDPQLAAAELVASYLRTELGVTGLAVTPAGMTVTFRHANDTEVTVHGVTPPKVVADLVAGGKDLIPELWAPVTSLVGDGLFFGVRPDRLMLPLTWRRPRHVSVVPVDVFHHRVPDEVLAQLLAVMHYARRHTFRLSTRFLERARELMANPDFQQAVWQVAEAMDVDGHLCQGFPPEPGDWPLRNVHITREGEVRN